MRISVRGVVSTFKDVIEDMFIVPALNVPKFKSGTFPTGVRFLYLKSEFNQNRVTSIGYKYITPTRIEYQVARCHNDKTNETWTVNDIFSRKIARDIIMGRMNTQETLKMEVKDKEELYNKFIMCYHPDHKRRRDAKKSLILRVFDENNIK